MFEKPTLNDLRYLELYKKIHEKRKKSWEKIPPDELEKANIRYIKFLIVQNLCEKVNNKIVVNPQNESPPVLDF
jgi:hypothetical protein